MTSYHHQRSSKYTCSLKFKIRCTAELILKIVLWDAIQTKLSRLSPAEPNPKTEPIGKVECQSQSCMVSKLWMSILFCRLKWHFACYLSCFHQDVQLPIACSSANTSKYFQSEFAFSNKLLSFQFILRWQGLTSVCKACLNTKFPSIFLFIS